MSLNLGELAVYAREIPSIEAAKQNVWNLIGRGKGVMDRRLQTQNLQLQQTLMGWETKDQPALETALKAYKSGYSILVDKRKEFTQYLDAAKEQCMKVERVYDPEKYDPFIKAKARELTLRQEAATTATKAQDKANEEAAFKTFVETEYFDIATQYRTDLRALIHQTYTACLSSKTPADKVQPAVNTCVAAMQTVQPRKMNKFNSVHLPKEDAAVIFGKIQRPKFADIYAEMIKELQAKFSLYANDLAVGEKAIQQQTQLFEQVTTQEKEQTEADKAAATLVNQATAMVTYTSTKPVIETTEIQVEDYSWEWVAKIMGAFMANFQACAAKVKNKKFSQMTVAQMAAALDAANVKVEGVNYQTLQK